MKTSSSSSSSLGFLWVVVVVSGFVSACDAETGPVLAPRSGGSPTQVVEDLRVIVDSEGLGALPAPLPVSDDLFYLGQALAFDKILSGDRNISCMTCHHPSLATGDARALPLGGGGAGLGATRAGGNVIPRNAPPLFNLHLFDTMFWDSRIFFDGDGKLVTPAGAQLDAAMEEVFDFGVVSAQAMFPVTSRHEMRGEVGSNEIADVPDGDLVAIWNRLMARLGGIPEYVAMFEAAYPGTDFDDMTFAHAANAIAAFEIGAFDLGNNPWNDFVAGDDAALTLPQSRGALDFFDSGCSSCHSGPILSDFQHHNTGLAQFGPGKGDGASSRDDFGRERVTGNGADRYAFRTPPLLNVELTAPYGHVGEFRDLVRFILHYEPADIRLESYRMPSNVSDTSLFPTLLDNRDDVLDNLSPLVDSTASKLSQSIATFLTALTDERALDLEHTIPAAVPSGLPVAD